MRAAAAQLFGDDVQQISYLWSLFTKTSLPYQDPDPKLTGDPAAWIRRNGPHVMVIQPGMTERDGKVVSLGYPFGVYPRLILAWVCTQAVLTGDDVLWLGPSMASFMRSLGLKASPSGGRTGSITRVREQAKRLFEASISMRWEGDDKVDRGAKLHIARLWNMDWTDIPETAGQVSLFPAEREEKHAGSFIQLDSVFAERMRESAVPLLMEAMLALRRSPFAMDVYFWLTWRMFSLRHPVTVSWEALKLQFGSAYASTKQGNFEFRKDFKKHLVSVKGVFPQARVDVADAGVVLYPSPTSVPPQAKPRKLVIPAPRR